MFSMCSKVKPRNAANTQPTGKYSSLFLYSVTLLSKTDVYKSVRVYECVCLCVCEWCIVFCLESNLLKPTLSYYLNISTHRHIYFQSIQRPYIITLHILYVSSVQNGIFNKQLYRGVIILF